MARTILLSLLIASQAFAGTLVSDEAVAVSVKPGGIECRDAIRDNGFGGAPAAVFVDPKNLIDPTLRARGVWLSAELPHSEKCSRVARKLRGKIPQALQARRVLQREESKQMLVGEISLPIPELGVVLKGEQSWLEAPVTSDASAPGESGRDRSYLPENFYRIEADLSAALVCAGDVLTLEGVSGGQSNVSTAQREFESVDECEAARAEVIEKSEPIAAVLLKRNVRSEFQRPQGIKGHATCHEVQVDEILTEIFGIELRGKEIFPLKSVELSKCSP